MGTVSYTLLKDNVVIYQVYLTDMQKYCRIWYWWYYPQDHTCQYIPFSEWIL